jgi:hypothetical protein
MLNKIICAIAVLAIIGGCSGRSHNESVDQSSSAYESTSGGSSGGHTSSGGSSGSSGYAAQVPQPPPSANCNCPGCDDGRFWTASQPYFCDRLPSGVCAICTEYGQPYQVYYSCGDGC